MGVFRQSIEIARPPEDVWRLVGDLTQYDRFLFGTTQWQPSGDDRYWIHMQVGSVPVGGEVAVSVDDEDMVVAWETLRGTEHRARLWVDPLADRVSLLSIEVVFRLLGPFATLVEWTAGPIIRRNLVASMETARHLVEHDVPRDADA